MADWGIGKYEITGAQLAPVAEVVVDAVEPVAGRKTLDIACGSGNASLIAAERGAEVTGLDAAPRLIEVARERASEAGLEIDFVEGNMLDLPFPDASFDVVTSVFGVIFGDPPGAVAGEIGRVLGQTGSRLAFTTWTDEGLLPKIAARSREVTNEALDLPPTEEAPFDWGDEVGVRELFAEHGVMVQCERKEITFRGDSAEALNEEWNQHHPMWLARKQAIGDENFQRLSAEILEILKEGNESTDGSFSFTSTYLLALGSPV